MMDELLAKLWSDKILESFNKSTIFEHLMPEVTPVPQPQGPPTLHQMVADLIREGVSGYEYEMDEDEIARQILELIGKQ